MNLTKKQKSQLFTVTGTLRNRFNKVINEMIVDNGNIYTTTSSKRGVRTLDGDLIELLNIFGYKYSQGNDSPRGGASGNYIKVSKVALRTLISLKN